MHLLTPFGQYTLKLLYRGFKRRTVQPKETTHAHENRYHGVPNYFPFGTHGIPPKQITQKKTHKTNNEKQKEHKKGEKSWGSGPKTWDRVTRGAARTMASFSHSSSLLARWSPAFLFFPTPVICYLFPSDMYDIVRQKIGKIPAIPEESGMSPSCSPTMSRTTNLQAFPNDVPKKGPTLSQPGI